MKAYLGSFTVRRQPRSATRQAVPGAARFEPNWAVRFYIQGKEMLRSAKLYPVCDKCMACEGDPLVERKSCDCHRGAAKWAESWLITQTALLQAGEMKKLEELRTPKRWTPLKEVLEVYEKRGPADRKQRVNFLASIYEQATGRDKSQMVWEDLKRDLFLDWAELRQAAGRKGWLGAGAGKNMPEDGWQKLRALKAAGELPALDDTTVAPWNTTILTYLTSAKSIFGEKSRAKVLRGLEVPDLEEWRAITLELPCPKGHKAIEETVEERIEKGLAKLKEENRRVWLFFMLCDETGMRPVSVRRLTKASLTVLTAAEAADLRKKMAKEWRVDEKDLCDFGGLIKVQAAKHGNEVLTPVSADVVAVAQQVMTEGSLIGAKHVTESRELHTELNAWLRKRGVTGTHAAYLLRHRKGQMMRRFGGKAAVGATLGHKGEAMADRYSIENRVVPAVGIGGRKGKVAA